MERRDPASDRKAVNLTVKLKYRGIEEFAEQYATNLSPGGLFIRTREPKPAGTLVRFKVELASGQRVLQGEATVKWARGADDPSGPPGMGLEFEVLDPASDALVKRMLAPHAPQVPAGPALPSMPAVPGMAAFGGITTTGTMRGTGSFPVPARPPLAPEPQLMAPVTVRLDDDASVGGSSAEDDADAALAAAVNAARAAPVRPPPPLARPAQKPMAVEAPFVDPDIDIDLEFDLLVATTPAPAPGSDDDMNWSDLAKEDSEVDLLAPRVDDALSEAGSVVVAPDLAAELFATAPLNEEELFSPGPPGFADAFPPPPLSEQELFAPEPPSAQELFAPEPPSAEEHFASAPPSVEDLFGPEPVPEPPGVDEPFAPPPAFVAPPQQNASPPIIAIDLGASVTTCAALVNGQPTVLGRVGGKVAVALLECKRLAEAHLGGPIERAVIACPERFNQNQRERVRSLAAESGLKCERIVNAPMATALVYGFNRGSSGKVLVYDLNRDAFEATVLRIDGNVIEVLATGAETAASMQVLDKQVAEMLLARFEESHGVPFTGDAAAMQRVLAEAARVQTVLFDSKTVDVYVPALVMGPAGKPLDLSTQLTRSIMDGLAHALIERALAAAKRVMEQARVSPKMLDAVLLAGALTRMPAVRNSVKMLSEQPPRSSENPDDAVALGAALFSGTVDKVSSVVLIDVVPASIGIALPDGTFRPILMRATPLPAAATFTVATTRDEQVHFSFDILQGDNPVAVANNYLGSLVVEPLPSARKGAVQVTLSMRLGSDWVLHVEAKEPKSKAQVSARLMTRNPAAAQG